MTIKHSIIKTGDHYNGKVYCGHCDLFVEPSAFNVEFARCEKCMDTTRVDATAFWVRRLYQYRKPLPPIE